MNQIDQLEIYKTAGTDTRLSLSRDGYPMRIKKGQNLFNIRDRVNTVYLLISGYVVLYRENEDHGIRNIFLLGPGDFINEIILDGLTASIACSALSDITVMSYSRAALLEIMKRDFAFNQKIVNSMSLKIRKLYHMLESSTKPTKLDHQTSSRIWKFARDFGIQSDDCIYLPFELKITLLAGFVGSNRETVSRIVKKMATRGILSIEKGICRIYDLDALKNFGRE
ncbi:MAG: Crp/Fnr family transcriptional regulator [Lachnospiraceae bacterium]|nr:Crp/Fnr family transcriptional regulator [Lachnospiraceae bacterium]